MLEKTTKEFRDLFMVSDEAFIVLDPQKELASIVFRKMAKIPGFGTQVVEKGFPLKLISSENFKPCSLQIPASVARAVFYALSYGDKITMYQERIEKDRHVYMIYLTAVREYKGKGMVQINIPLGVAR